MHRNELQSLFASLLPHVFSASIFCNDFLSKCYMLDPLRSFVPLQKYNGKKHWAEFCTRMQVIGADNQCLVAMCMTRRPDAAANSVETPHPEKVRPFIKLEYITR